MKDMKLKIKIDAEADTKELTKSTKELKKLEKALAETEKTSGRYSKTYAELSGKTERARKDNEKLAKSVYKIKDANNKTLTSLEKAEIKTQQLAKADKKASEAVAKHAKSRKKSSTSLTTYAAGAAAAAVAVLAISKAGLAAINKFIAFDDQMRQVAAVSGATRTEFNKLTQSAIKLGSETRFTSTQAAEGMKFLSMAGFKAVETLEAMPGILDLAAGSMTDLGTTADIASNILTGFGLKTSEMAGVGDVLAKTFTTSNTNLRELGYAFSYVGPLAKSSGAAFTEVAMLLGKLADASYKGEKGGTILRGAYARLEKGMKPVIKTMQTLGVESHDSDGKLRKMTDILIDLGKKGITSGQALKIFGHVAGSGMISLIGQGEQALRDYQKTIDDAAGKSKELADAMEAGLGGAVRSLGSAWDNLITNQFGKGGEEATAGIKALTEALKDPAVIQTVRDLGQAFGVVLGWVARLAAFEIEKFAWLYQLTQLFSEPKEKVKELGTEIDEAAARAKGLSTALTEGANVNLQQPAEALRATQKELIKLGEAATAAYTKASSEAEKYAQKAIEWAQKVLQANLTTEQKVAELKRQGLTEDEKRASRQFEIKKTLLAMEEAAANGEYKRAESLAKHAESLTLANIGNQKKVTQAQLDDYEKIRALYISKVIKPQKDAADEQAKTAKTSADKIKAVIDELEGKEIKIGFSQAELQKMKAQITDIDVRVSKPVTKIVYIQEVVKKALGGLVHAANGFKIPGAPNERDSVFAMLSNGERVINAFATQAWDKTIPGFMDTANRLRSASDIKNFLQRFQGLAAGGLAVQMPSVPKLGYAGGGVAASSPTPNFGKVDFNFNGKSFQMFTDKSVFDSLKRSITREKSLGAN